MNSTDKMSSNTGLDVQSIESVKILAWDYSYSTNKATRYHQHAKTYLDDFSKSYETTVEQNKPIYLTWSDECSAVTLQELQNICLLKQGTEGTYPSTIISWIDHNIPKEKSVELWLITDGEIGTDEMQVCSLMNAGISYSQINFIVISEDRTNLSVGASFFRGAQIRIFYNDSLFKEIDVSTPFDYDSISLENFDDKWSSLSDFIQAKFMGCDIESLEEVDKLSALRRRLFNLIGGENNETGSLRPKFSSKKKTDLLATFKSCQFYQNIVSLETKKKRDMIEAKISALINHIHSRDRPYNFDSLKIDYKQAKMDFIKEQPEPSLQNLDDFEKCTLFDAVTLEEEESVPVLLLSVNDLIQQYWINGNFTKFRTVMDCPLMAKMDNCIGHVYTYATFKSLCNSTTGQIINPLTNETVFGGLIFNQAANKWNDYVLAKSFFNGKKVNTCLALWYYVIWENAKSKPWIEPAVIDLLWSYACLRMKHAKVRIAFNRLPLDPKQMVSLPVACFYSTEGPSLLFGESPDLFLQERMRQFWPVAGKMLHILKTFGYEVDEEFVTKRAKLFEVINDLKRIPQEMEKKYFLLQKAYKSTGAFLTYSIKDETALPLLHVLKYHHTTSMIPFNFDAQSSDPRSLLLVSYDTTPAPVPTLCSNTYRPYFVVESDSNLLPNYNQLLPNISDVTLGSDGGIANKSAVATVDQTKIVPCCKLYIDLTKRLKRFPTIDEYSQYIWKVKRFWKNRVRLFCPNMTSDIKKYYDLYSTLGVDIEHFIKTTQQSVAISDRIKLEQSLKGISVEEFIKTSKSLLAKTSSTTAEEDIVHPSFQCPPRIQIKRTGVLKRSRKTARKNGKHYRRRF